MMPPTGRPHLLDINYLKKGEGVTAPLKRNGYLVRRPHLLNEVRLAGLQVNEKLLVAPLKWIWPVAEQRNGSRIVASARERTSSRRDETTQMTLSGLRKALSQTGGLD